MEKYKETDTAIKEANADYENFLTDAFSASGFIAASHIDTSDASGVPVYDVLLIVPVNLTPVFKYTFFPVVP